MIPMGTLIQNAHVHEKFVVRYPPTRGPRAAIPPMIEP
jgi:hypothetical protein